MNERQYFLNTKQNHAIGDFWIRKTVNSPFSAPSSHKVWFWHGIEDRGGRKIGSILTLDIFYFRPYSDPSAITSTFD
jgi:hypothetical protein